MNENSLDLRNEELTILAIDDDARTLGLIKAYCQELFPDAKFVQFLDPQESLSWAGNNHFDLALIDYKMPQLGGIDLSQALKDLNPISLHILITAYAELGKAVEALRAGMFDFLAKPIDLDDFEIAIARAINHLLLNRQNRLLKEYLKEGSGMGKFLGQSADAILLVDKVKKFARYDAPVLITGETGVGKELVARMIHCHSKNSNDPFVAVTCSALSESLLESELFGHVKGAFTGAANERIGRLEYAGKGVVLLDELCEIPLSMQVKLLRVIQEKEFERIGSNKPIKLKARIISATNKNIFEQVDRNSFREDLFYRINTLHINIPPLRQRKEDIEIFCNHFIKKYSLIHNKKINGLTDEASQVVRHYLWPGNVRQLQNAIERAVIECSETSISSENLPPELFNQYKHKEPSRDMSQKGIDNVEGETKRELSRQMDRDQIINALENNRWNKTKTASELGLTLSQLIYRIKKLNI